MLLLAACGGGNSSPADSSVSTSYTLGGNVSGLSTDGLVLRYGAEALSIAPASTRFTFVSRLRPGDLYSVLVDTQPSARDEFCTVARGAGAVGHGDIESIQVTCRPPAWTVSTLAGSGGAGAVDGTGYAAWLNAPQGLANDASGNLYAAEANNNLIRKVTPRGEVTTYAGTGSRGSQDGPRASASFNAPLGVAVDAQGQVYVADSDNHTIRKISTDGIVSIFAGISGVEGSQDGPSAVATFRGPDGVAVDSAGNVYVSDARNRTVRKISASGVVSTLAGTPGVQGQADGPGNAATFSWPSSVAVDPAGTVYVTDTNAHTIRKISPQGQVSTLAGSPNQRGWVDGTGINARFHTPLRVAVDAQRNVYVTDAFNRRVRKITPDGRVTTLVGSSSGAGVEDGVGTAASLAYPIGLSVNQQGVLYVGDGDTNRIRRIEAR